MLVRLLSTNISRTVTREHIKLRLLPARLLKGRTSQFEARRTLMADSNGSGHSGVPACGTGEEPPKTAKQLKKEAQKNEKLAKYKDKVAKQQAAAAAVGQPQGEVSLAVECVIVCGAGVVWGCTVCTGGGGGVYACVL